MNAVNWFEIPVQDFDRAVNFYEALLQISMERMLFDNVPNALFPYKDGVGGAIAQVPYANAGDEGLLVYLNVSSMEVLDKALAQVENLGGEVLMPKKDIGNPGHIAVIRDTEGNRVGLNVRPGA